LERNGIPTVTVVTSAFEELAKTTMKEQQVTDMSFVVVEHPIAGRDLEDTRKLVDKAFPDILKVATQRQPKG
jgi:hypothetical protein